MLPQHVLVLLVAAVSAVPLNINLGAYSPALVVGDGEISLGSTERASELMQTLASGAAANGGQGQQGQQRVEQPAEGQPAEQPKEGEQAAEQPTEGKRDVSAPNLVRTIEHLGKREAAPESEDGLALAQEAMEWIKRDIAGFREALTYAREAMKDTPKIELGTENAGVGIVVNPGLNVAANSAANGAKPAGGKKSKRSEAVAEESEAPKMTLVAITEV